MKISSLGEEATEWRGHLEWLAPVCIPGKLKGYSADWLRMSCAYWRGSILEAWQGLEEGDGVVRRCGRRASCTHYVVAGSLAAYARFLSSFLIAKKEGWVQWCLLCCPNPWMAILDAYFCFSWAQCCPGRLGYYLSRGSVQVLCGSGKHPRGLDADAMSFKHITTALSTVAT